MKLKTLLILTFLLITALVIIYIDHGIKNYGVRFHTGKDGGYFMRFEFIVYLNTIWYILQIFRSKKKVFRIFFSRYYRFFHRHSCWNCLLHDNSWRQRTYLPSYRNSSLLCFIFRNPQTKTNVGKTSKYLRESSQIPEVKDVFKIFKTISDKNILYCKFSLPLYQNN